MPKTSARLLALLSLLQARRDWPGALLAERLDISARTVRRDIDRLRELGYPIHTAKGPDGGYRLEAGTQLPPLLFDDDQAVALAVALRIATTAGAGIEEGATRALNTIRQVMPTRLRRRIDSIGFTSVERPSLQRIPQADSSVLAALSVAVQVREVLRFDYQNVGDASNLGPPRRVEPHNLVTWSGRWYLVGWDLDRDDWRIYRADRITPKIPTGPRFTPRELREGGVAGFVTAKFQGGSGGWPCRGEVILDLPAADVARFTHDGIVEAVGEDRCRLVAGSWSWPALAARIGRFDADFEVVGPPELEEAFERLSRRYARAMRGPIG
jgi:predicted DNA-binding transcriptional regulator YafY